MYQNENLPITAVDIFFEDLKSHCVVIEKNLNGSYRQLRLSVVRVSGFGPKNSLRGESGFCKL